MIYQEGSRQCLSQAVRSQTVRNFKQVCCYHTSSLQYLNRTLLSCHNSQRRRAFLCTHSLCTGARARQGWGSALCVSVIRDHIIDDKPASAENSRSSCGLLWLSHSRTSLRKKARAAAKRCHRRALVTSPARSTRLEMVVPTSMMSKPASIKSH